MESRCGPGQRAGCPPKGGTCATVCGYCGTAGLEVYDGSGGSWTALRYNVHWRCYR